MGEHDGHDPQHPPRPLPLQRRTPAAAVKLVKLTPAELMQAGPAEPALTQLF